MTDILDLTLRRLSNVKGVLHKDDKDGSLILMVRITSIKYGRHLVFYPQTTFKSYGLLVSYHGYRAVCEM